MHQSELEQLYQRVVSRVIANVIPVVLMPGPTFSGVCLEDRIEIGARLEIPYRLYALAHELGHHYLHREKQGGSRRHRDEEEFEASWVGRKVYQRFGIGDQSQLKVAPPTYDAADLFTRYPPAYFEKRVNGAVEKIWKVIRE